MTEKEMLYNKFDILSEEGILETKYQDIPPEIKDNLNPKYKLREYQNEAFRRFFYYMNEYKKANWPVHVLFNMATGSGKTLIMAGLILYLYKRGYTHFVFFVNSKNIIEKTKNNFISSMDEKYLFDQTIEINNEKIRIKQANDILGNPNNEINILFTTIQKFHRDLYDLKENSLTYDDFSTYKTVFIADEAHHLNISTKSQQNKEKENWEETVVKALNKNEKNILLEFTATVEMDNIYIKEKYRNKIIYKFDLKEFRNKGYSKEIRLLESDFNKKERILQALILNEYRRQVAIKSKIPELTNFKPVILFKSKQSIEESKNNFLYFMDIIDNLDVKDIEIIKSNKNKASLINDIFAFFDAEGISDRQLVLILKRAFSKEKCLITNEENLDKKTIKENDIVEILNQQDVLNSLENPKNKTRAIFTVNKLTEGWDVLNLFDIVRLYTGQTMGGSNKKKPGKTTIQEAQLIGRGARYFPFKCNEMAADKRKFDSDLDQELRILEEVHYHCHPGDKSRYISEITQTLKNQGLLDEEDTVRKKLKLKNNFKVHHLYKNGVIYANKKLKIDLSKINNIKDLGVHKNNITYNLVTGLVNEENVFEENSKLNNLEKEKYTLEVKNIQRHIIKKAMAKNKFYAFENLKSYLPTLSSINEFIYSDGFLASLRINFVGTKENISCIANKIYLEAMIKLLNKLEEDIKKNFSMYRGTLEFYPKYTIKNTIREKTLEIKKGSEREKGQENFIKDKDWYVFESNYGTPEEKILVEYMEPVIKILSKEYKDIFLIRNEREVKIYDFDTGTAFEPDFILLLRDIKTNQEIGYQFFIEPKGEGFKNKDLWKEDFLLEIKNRYKLDGLINYCHFKDLNIVGLPFFNQNDTNRFVDQIYKELY